MTRAIVKTFQASRKAATIGKEAGDTVGYVKTTYGPDGSIIHITDNLNP